MSDDSDSTRAAFSVRTAELAVATFFFLLGAIVIVESVRLGASWSAEGPLPGYFPFYLGVLICVASVVNFVAGLRLRGPRNQSFVETGQLKLVLSVLLPSVVFVAAVGWLGIYVSATVYIGVFMRWFGKYAWWKLTAVAVGFSVVFYLIFEVWFKVPLPKGPIEAWLGLD